MEAKTVILMVKDELLKQPIVTAFYSLQDKDVFKTIESYVDNLIDEEYFFNGEHISIEEIFFYFKHEGNRPSFALEDTLITIINDLGQCETERQTDMIHEAIESGIEYLKKQI